MEKRKAIIFVAIAVAVLVSAMSMGCVDQQQKEEVKEELGAAVDNVTDDLGTTKRDIETGMAIQEIKESEEAAELKEVVEKAKVDVSKEHEKAVTEAEKAAAGVAKELEKAASKVEEKVEEAKADVGEAAEKLVEEKGESFETVKTGIEGIINDTKETLTNESKL